MSHDTDTRAAARRRRTGLLVAGLAAVGLVAGGIGASGDGFEVGGNEWTAEPTGNGFEIGAAPTGDDSIWHGIEDNTWHVGPADQTW